MTRFVLAAAVSMGVCALVDTAGGDSVSRPMLTAVASSVGWFALAPRAPHRVALCSVATLAAVSVCTALGLSPALGLGGVWGLCAPMVLKQPADGHARVQTLLLSLAGAHTGLWLGLQALDPTRTGEMAVIALITASATLLGAAPLYWQPRRQRPTVRQVQVRLAQPYRPAVLSALRLTDRGIPLAPDRATAAGLDEVCAWVFRLQQSAQQLGEDLSLIDEAGASAALQASTTPASAENLRTHQHHRQVIRHCEVLRAELARTDTTIAFAQAWLADAVAGLSVARARPDDVAAPDFASVLERLRAHGDVTEAQRRTQREFTTPVSA